MKIGLVYIVHWKPTKYLYKHIGRLLRDEQTTLIFENEDCEVRVQKKFITYIIEQ